MCHFYTSPNLWKTRSALSGTLGTPTQEGSPYLIIEEMYGVIIKLQGQGLQEGDIVCHDLLIGEVKLMDDDGVHMVVRQQVICVQEERRGTAHKRMLEGAVVLDAGHRDTYRVRSRDLCSQKVC